MAMTYEVELLPTDCADCRPADVVREPLPRKFQISEKSVTQLVAHASCNFR
jgi:hypothetical protein